MRIRTGIDGGDIRPIGEVELSALRSRVGSYLSSYAGEDQEVETYNFVGIVILDNKDTIAVFPKHYRFADTLNPIEDVRLLFRTLLKTKQKENVIGSMGWSDNESVISDYPFRAFFKVYDYYRRYGIYIEDDIYYRSSPPGQVSWKKTISHSQKYLFDDKLVIWPLRYKKKRYETTFLTECMIYVLEKTISSFGFLLGMESTGNAMPDFDFAAHEEYTVSKLLTIKQKIFRDATRNLIDALIEFFRGGNAGDGLVLRVGNFDKVWELMVGEYLRNHCAGANDKGELVFQQQLDKKLDFIYQYRVKNFNDANPDQPIYIDHYLLDQEHKIQYILDEKYYRDNVNLELNYKQVFYTALLHRCHKDIDKTVSVLLLPCEGAVEPRKHFSVNQKYSQILGGIEDVPLVEQCLDMHDVMKDYNEGNNS